ncbi:hypothetical protein HK101_001233 [Irineochytrium annulatum]|nr:hypothetical protein HK101_001233 [Irineochytrium annulatum]
MGTSTIFVEGADGNTITLDAGAGETTDGEFRVLKIGRALLKSDNKRLSREQAHIRYSLQSGQVFFKQTGTNSSQIKRAIEPVVKVTSKNHEYVLKHGDAFWLDQLENDYKFVLRVIKDDDNRGHGRVSDTDVTDLDEPSVTKKESNPDRRKVCEYGEKCYRRNPDHFRDFAHPWLDEKDGRNGKRKGRVGGGGDGKGSAAKKMKGNVDGDRGGGRDWTSAVKRLGGDVKGSEAKKIKVGDDAGGFVRDAPWAKRPVLLEDSDDEEELIRQPVAKREPTPVIPSPTRHSNAYETVPSSFGSAKGSPPPKSEATTPAEKTKTPAGKSSPLQPMPAPTPPKPATKLPAASSSSSKSAAAKAAERLFEDPQKLTEPTAIAFSPLGTIENQLDPLESAQCAVEVIKRFLAKNTDDLVKIYVVDNNDVTVNALKKSRDVSHMKTEMGVECRFVAVESNWRLKHDTTFASRKVHERAGPTLAIALKEQHPKTAKIGEAYAVKVPDTSPLLLEEGVHHVIHVVAPNLNPSRPDPIKDLAQVAPQLTSAYEALLDSFAGVTGLAKIGRGVVKGAGAAKNSNAFDLLMSVNPSSSAPTPRQPTSSATGPAKPGAPSGGEKRYNYGGGRWDMALIKYTEIPHTFSRDVVHKYDDEYVVVHDLYPKARKHFLVMPRRRIDSVYELRAEHLDVLDGMKERADEIVREFPAHTFRLGFHAIPSMKQVHLHVLSLDMLSPALKNRKHWNSFTTRFFMPFDLVRSAIAGPVGKVEIDTREYEAMLKKELECHRCGQALADMGKLRSHLEGHERMRS